MVASLFGRVVAAFVLVMSSVLVVPVASAGAASGAVSPDQAFVTAAYQDFLGRNPSPTELTAATRVSLATSEARANVVGGLSTSPEWIRVTVNKLYVDTLGRPGDSGGVNYWVSMITSGRLSVAGVAASFYSSPEYFTGFGHSNVRTWVLDLYTKILLRDGAKDLSGVTYWVNTTATAGRGAVTNAFYQSNESRHTRVKGLYGALLGRAPDRGGWDYWAGLITTRGDLALAANLAESSEYYNRAFTRYGMPATTAPSAPSGVTATAGNGKVTVTWVAPATNGGSPITGYTVTSTPGSKTCVSTGALTCTVTGLTNGTAYTFKVTATNAAGTSVASAPSVTVTPTAPVTITSATLPDATAGLPYTGQVEASGGFGTYTWTLTGAPGWLSITADGYLTGQPAVTGPVSFTVHVADTTGHSASATESIAVPTALPGACVNKSCQIVTKSGYTTEVGGSQITAVVRNPEGQVTQVTMTGTGPAVGQIMVISAGTQTPTGLVVLVTASTPGPNGTTVLTVTKSTMGEAYASGHVHVVDPAAVTSAATSGPSTFKLSTAGPHAAAPASAGLPSLTCSGGVQAGISATVKPTFEAPDLDMVWNHPVFGFHGIYLGSGGLKQFYARINGQITASMSGWVSGTGTCTVGLPSATVFVPAGPLGAVTFGLAPSLTFNVNGKVNLNTSVDLWCSSSYGWNDGATYRFNYCQHATAPLQLAADSGIDATLTGSIAASVTWNDLAGITGTISAALHASYTPFQHPIAELDATVNSNLSVCLLCFWDGTPLKSSIANGEIYHQVLATYDTNNPLPPPPPPPAGGHLTDLTNVTSITTSGSTTCAVAGGNLYCWGNNHSGQVGNGDTTGANVYSPYKLPLTNVTSINTNAGASNTCAVAGGSAYCWGYNHWGQVGNGDSTGANVYSPYKLPLTNVTSTSTNLSGTCAVAGGNGYCWGGNVGNGDIYGAPVYSPYKLPLTNVTSITANAVSCAVAGGKGYCWGNNYYGDVGNGSTSHLTVFSPYELPLTNVTSITVQHSTCAVAGGNGYCWGDNTYGLVGNGDTTGAVYSPYKLPLTNVTGITNGVYEFGGASCAVAGGKGYCWGNNTYGQLGNG